jgi:hypothetical protein
MAIWIVRFRNNPGSKPMPNIEVGADVVDVRSNQGFVTFSRNTSSVDASARRIVEAVRLVPYDLICDIIKMEPVVKAKKAKVTKVLIASHR